MTSQKVQLKSKVTDADGDKSALTFEVWTADAAGNPLKKVSIDDNEWGVIVSPYVASGSTVTVDVPVGKLALSRPASSGPTGPLVRTTRLIAARRCT
ncbi:hypothetical protein [Streptomyces swartbergensis]|uniref:hypothetical protein n=1 Tax=Streptomyces swartbergensis TaxID=487165 RepID=UPI003800D6E7